MSEWWTYRLTSFLMFSPRTYWRVVEQFNRDLWPAQVVALAAGAVLVGLAARGGRHAGTIMGLALAAAWVNVGWSFFWLRYAQIFTAAPFLAVACGVQAALLLVAAARDGAVHRVRTGWFLAALAIGGYPLAGVVVTGRPWAQAECFGLMPDPTALATIGLAMCMPGSRVWRAVLCVIPAIVLFVGWGTLTAMAQRGG